MTSRSRALVGCAAACAILGTACGDAGTEPNPPGSRSFTAAGTVHTLAGPLPAGLTATLVSGSVRVSAPVAANGAFSVQANVPGDSADVIIDAEGLNRTVLPSLVRVSTLTAASGLRLVLVPRTWTVSGGAHDGRAVTVSLVDAFRAPCQTPGDTNCDGFYPRAWTTGIKMWPATGFPVPVAFDRARSHQAISAADSAAFWTIVKRMNSDLGVEIFRPERVENLGLAADGRPASGVALRVDTTLSGFGAWTNWWWNASGDMYAGVVRPRSAALLGSPSLMTHELLHTQGIKHSCSWATVMGGYGCGSMQALTVHDVAYFQLARAMFERQRATGASVGLVAALQGERVVLLNLPLAVLGDADRLRVLRGDSIIHGDHAH